MKIELLKRRLQHKSFLLLRWQERLLAGYWFVPSSMAIAAVALSSVMLAIDRLNTAPWTGLIAEGYFGGPNGALMLLSTVAGSTITVAGTVFSVTLVALALASQQFGPRVLRNFMQDIHYQSVLGTFVATFIYCLLILRTVRVDPPGTFVPHLSVAVAILLALAGIVVLIYFIHHAATSINAWHIIREISGELEENIIYMFSGALGQAGSTTRSGDRIDRKDAQQGRSIPAQVSGYIRSIDYQHLLRLAREHDLLLNVCLRPGKFVVSGSELAIVWPAERASRRLIVQISEAFILGRERTPFQDVEFSIKQLVEIAIRAISPAINDPFTAIRCIDQLCAALCSLAEKDFPSGRIYDGDHRLRVMADQVTFLELLDDAFHQIRQYSRTDVAVTIRLLEAITTIAEHAHLDMNRAALLHHAEMIASSQTAQIYEPFDREDIARQYGLALQTLQQK
ncbi:DUF2254 domain-containing protein [Gloeobacter kilaueensis]|uniref:DUF2254 domain-containing protein n=1 Tax=Gloeobacter kilaueensis TaxID=1416614 RepID=UPI001CB73BFA|nr:DUF2254 domain-containing protein [Gloeobacter kilaueensis]